MTQDELMELAYTIRNAWPGEFDEDNIAVYAKVLLDLDYAVADAAVMKLIRDGQRFVPSLGLLMQAVEEVTETPVPTWTEAWDQLRKVMARAAMDDYKRPAAEVGEKAGAHPMVVAFAEQEGIRRLAHEPFFEPEHGDLRIKQLGGRFKEFCDMQQHRARRRAALDAAGVAGELGAADRS